MPHTKDRQQRLLREVNTLARAHIEKRREGESIAQQRFDSNIAKSGEHSIKVKSGASQNTELLQAKVNRDSAVPNDAYHQEIVSLTTNDNAAKINNDNVAKLTFDDASLSEVEIFSHRDAQHLSDKNLNVAELFSAKKQHGEDITFNANLEIGLHAFDLMAIDLGQLFRACKQDFKQANWDDKLSVSSALVMFFGAFMPWISEGLKVTHMGISTVGVVHFLVSLVVVYRLIFEDWGHRDFGQHVNYQQKRVGALQLLLLSFVSVMSIAWFFVYWGFQKTASFHIELHFGAYLSLFASLGLAFSAYMRWKTWIKEMHLKS